MRHPRTWVLVLAACVLAALGYFLAPLSPTEHVSLERG